MRIVIAEDDDPKYQRIRSVLLGQYPEASIVAASAANSALNALRSTAPELLVLDMSLPTFEIGRGEPGGRPQDFGGLEVMDHMDAEGIVCPIIIVTQHEGFPLAKGEVMSRADLAIIAKDEHPDTFVGLIYYRSVANDWEDELLRLCTNVLGGGRQ